MKTKTKLFTGILLVLFSIAFNGQAQNKPNILFLFADDQRADALGCAGNLYIHTPNIDKLAERGVRFSNSYVMGGHHGAICAPSRAMLMSGKSLFNVHDRLAGVQTMPRYFSEYGYVTFGTGKWHNEKSAFEATFQKGKNVFLGGMSDHFNVPARDMGADGKLGEPQSKGYSTDIFAEAAMGFINEYANGDRNKPFFCYVAFTAPHDPRSPRPDYIGMYPDESIPVPGNFKKLHPFAFDELAIRDENLAPWPRTPEIIQASIADYYALISHLDDKVGEIVETLIKKDLFENTIIVYAADNGLAIGSHGLIGKQNLYEHSVKVPVIISGPGIPKEKVNDALVYLYDLFPTLCAASSLPVPKEIDGKNLMPVIKGEKAGVRNSLFTAYRNTVRAVRTDEWKLIRYPQINFTQLYNLKSDPLELNNLASLPEQKPRVDEMMDLLKEWVVESNDTINLNPSNILPMDYDYTKLKQKADIHQPEYILNKYFGEPAKNK
ncbi:MAG: sulfatase-like hydrolase/transferase [Draconibacterium sp.]|nr:sulfatase-like hydrolase/transferase [Draconibacterium sp.]